MRLLHQRYHAIRRSAWVRLIVAGNRDRRGLVIHRVGHDARCRDTTAMVLQVYFRAGRINIAVERLVVAAELHLKVIGVIRRLHDRYSVVGARSGCGDIEQRVAVLIERSPVDVDRPTVHGDGGACADRHTAFEHVDPGTKRNAIADGHRVGVADGTSQPRCSRRIRGGDGGR